MGCDDGLRPKWKRISSAPAASHQCESGRIEGAYLDVAICYSRQMTTCGLTCEDIPTQRVDQTDSTTASLIYGEKQFTTWFTQSATTGLINAAPARDCLLALVKVQDPILRLVD